MENEHGESYDQIKLICFEDVLKKLEHIQEINKDTFLNLNAKKQEIWTNTGTKVKELKCLLDKAHN